MTALAAAPLEAALTWVHWHPCNCGRKHAAIYCRQSLDRDGSGTAVARQREACEEIATVRGWHVIAVYVDNDVSGYSGKKRPGFDAVMTLVRDRKVHVVIAWAVDRLTRRMADLEQIIDTATSAGVVIVTANGDLDLSTDTGRMVARILGSVATGEVERKSTRQKLAAQQAARAGKRWRSSQRPFGWSADDYAVPVPEEAEAIREGCRLIIAGGTISGVARTWTAMGVKPAQGDPRWGRQSVRAILLNPAVCALRAYKGEIIAKGDWPEIVPEETWKAVKGILTDPRRVVPRGTRTLLGGIGVCRCGNRVTHTHAQQGHGVYRCEKATRDQANGPHVSVKSETADWWVTEAIIARMSQPDAVTLFTTDSTVDVQALRDESMSIRANLDTLAADMAVGLISRSAMLAATERANARLAEIDRDVAEAAREHVAAELVTAQDVQATWEALDISRQRAIVRALLTVELRPVGRGGRFPSVASLRAGTVPPGKYRDPAAVFALTWTA